MNRSSYLDVDFGVVRCKVKLGDSPLRIGDDLTTERAVLAIEYVGLPDLAFWKVERTV